MGKLTALFNKRIGMPENEAITFGKLPEVLERTALTIPFENLTVIQNRISKVNKENLFEKIIERNEGGLCYELNPFFYYYLIENGFHAVLADGVVYNHAAQDYHQLGRTHVTILINHEGQTYLIDTGFGANLPLLPVPLSGETVSSTNGEFRLKKEMTEHGDYVLEMKLKHKDPDWKIGYAFDSRKPITESTLNEIQTIIAEHPNSSFNKQPLLTCLTKTGSITLTNTSFTQWVNGTVTKETIEDTKFGELAKQHFGM